MTNHTCIYCGQDGATNNPADFLHYSDSDVFGKAYCCDFCNHMITRTNRSLSQILYAKNAKNLPEAQRILKRLITNLETSNTELQWGESL